MTLFARSMPPPTPKAMMAKLTASAITSQKLLPQPQAVPLKLSTMTFISCPMAKSPPSSASAKYLKIQPTTQL